MKNIFISSITVFLIVLTFYGCSKKQPEPYYDRANQASEKAHEKLSKD